MPCCVGFLQFRPMSGIIIKAETRMKAGATFREDALAASAPQPDQGWNWPAKHTTSRRGAFRASAPSKQECRTQTCNGLPGQESAIVVDTEAHEVNAAAGLLGENLAWTLRQLRQDRG